MKTAEKKLYEAMFLVDSAEATSDWQGINDTIRKILDRNKAEIVSLKKWDERWLAYPINGKTRGTYMLCYFKGDGTEITGIERDVRLSEKIMRVLILRADNVSAKEASVQAAEEKTPEPQQTVSEQAQNEDTKEPNTAGNNQDT